MQSPINSGDARLARDVGVLGLSASIVNITIGGGIFRLPATVADGLGAAAPVAYIVCSVAMGLIVACFAIAGRRVSGTGGVYAYATTAFGPLIGVIVGMLLWAGITAAFAAVTSFLGDAMAALVPTLGGRAARPLSLASVLLVLAALNVRGVKSASGFNMVVTLVKLLPLATLVVFGAFSVKSSNLAWPGTPSLAAVTRASAFLIFAFMGIETALVPSGEVRDPARTVPRAVVLAIVAVAAVYLAIQLVTQGLLGAALSASKTPLADAAAASFGASGRTLMLVATVLSMFGFVGAMTLSVPRIMFALADDGYLPRVLARVHQRFRTPHLAILAQAVLVLLLSLSGTFERLAIIANGAILLVFAACCLAAFALRRRELIASSAPAIDIWRAALVPACATAVIAWLLTGLRPNEWLAIGFVIVLALTAYAITRGTRAGLGVARAEAS